MRKAGCSVAGNTVEGGVGNDDRGVASVDVDDASAVAAVVIDGLELAVGDETRRSDPETAGGVSHAIGKVGVGEGEGFELVDTDDPPRTAVGVETAVVDVNAGGGAGSGEELVAIAYQIDAVENECGTVGEGEELRRVVVVE